MPSTRPAHRPSAREAIRADAETHLRAHGSLSLDSAAKAAGVSKAGLMYHFPTKEDLMAAVLDRIITGYERQFEAYLPGSHTLETATTQERLTAYLMWASQAELDATDLIIFTDPRLRGALTAQWVERLEPWLKIPEHLSTREQQQLLAARLMADGVWFARASGTLHLTQQQIDGVQEMAAHLMKDVTS